MSKFRRIIFTIIGAISFVLSLAFLASDYYGLAALPGLIRTIVETLRPFTPWLALLASTALLVSIWIRDDYRRKLLDFFWGETPVDIHFTGKFHQGEVDGYYCCELINDKKSGMAANLSVSLDDVDPKPDDLPLPLQLQIMNHPTGELSMGIGSRKHVDLFHLVDARIMIPRNETRTELSDMVFKICAVGRQDQIPVQSYRMKLSLHSDKMESKCETIIVSVNDESQSVTLSLERNSASDNAVPPL